MNLLALGPILVLPLLGDVVVLTNGNEIQGEVEEDSAGRVIVKFPGGVLELQRKQVAEVRRERRIDYLLQEADKQLRRGSYAEAVSTYVEATREAPSSTPAREGLRRARERMARGLADMGRFDDARAAYRAILVDDPASRGLVDAELKVIDATIEDARKEEERGLRELSSGDLEQGIFRLKRVHDRFADRRKDLAPTIGRALIRQGIDLLRAERWEEAETRLSQALVIEPELHPEAEGPLVEARRRRIEPLIAGGDFAAAEALVREGLESSPTSDVLRYYHGLCLEAADKKREAAEEYLAIVDVKRPANPGKAVRDLRLKVEAELLDGGRVSPTASPQSREVLPGDFRRLTTQHFVILHKNEAVARDVALVAERSYAATFAELRCVAHPKNPLEITLFPTQEEYVRASGHQSWSGGSHAVARRRGVFSDHRIFSYQGQPCLTTAILPHEIGHALLVHRLNYPESVPLWANEAYAMTREPRFLQTHRRKLVVEEMRRGLTIPLRELLAFEDYPADRYALFYSQSFSLAEFLIGLEDMDTFIRFVESLSKRGTEVEEALGRHYAIAGVAALENRWIAWFERQNG